MHGKRFWLACTPSKCSDQRARKRMLIWAIAVRVWNKWVKISPFIESSRFLKYRANVQADLSYDSLHGSFCMIHLALSLFAFFVTLVVTNRKKSQILSENNELLCSDPKEIIKSFCKLQLSLGSHPRLNYLSSAYLTFWTFQFILMFMLSSFLITYF